ncbi:MAG: hypothetical protein GX580_06685 [Candidatus Hydrogenedens sp.]|nr:hypothetical protein [Candidatus Hydrogenedens sp.]
MRETSADIAKLCESWWEKLADATRMEQQSYVRRLLELLGWEDHLPFTPKPAAAALSALPCLLRGDGQCMVAAYFLPPGALDSPASVVERGLDHCPATKALLDETRAPGIHYLLATDLHRSYLYDARTEELLLHADDPRVFNADLAPALRRQNVERGSLEDLRRQPRSVVARRLREWNQRWAEHLRREGRISEEAASLPGDRLCVARFLFGHDILRRTRDRLARRFGELVARASGVSPRGCGADLVRLFHDMWLDWRVELFAPCPELDTLLARDDIAAPWLREAGLLGRNKFTLAAVLESFNHGDPAEKMRVRMVPEENEERDLYLARLTLDTVDAARVAVDVTEEGYRAVTHWFDRLVAAYDRLDTEFDRHSRAAAPPVDDLDLFAWSEMDARRPAACADKLGHACSRGLTVYCAGARQRRVSLLLLTLHLISRLESRHEAADRLPDAARALAERPRVLPAAGKVMGINAPPDETGGLDD